MGGERPTPESCATMTELRALIDQVDGELFDLFAARMACIHRAAELKRGEGLPANVPSRVAEVVANARAHAERRDLDPDLYGRIWRMIVDASIAEEEKELGAGDAA